MYGGTTEVPKCDMCEMPLGSTVADVPSSTEVPQGSVGKRVVTESDYETSASEPEKEGGSSNEKEENKSKDDERGAESLTKEAQVEQESQGSPAIICLHHS